MPAPALHPWYNTAVVYNACMLASQFRLKKKHDIEYILSYGKLFHGRLTLAKYVPNTVGHHRFSIITSHKFAKKAVKRNRAKRQISEALRLALPQMPSPPGRPHFDCAIIPKKSIFKTDFQNISREIGMLLKTLQ